MKLNLDRLYQEDSPISGRIEVYQFGVERKLIINGGTQSIYRVDGSERGYWTGMVPPQPISSALLMGLGGGTVGRLLRKKWPQVKITAYDLDPIVVRVAAQYFELDPKIEVRIDDARKAFMTGERYEFVAVDMYSGIKIAPFIEDQDFLISVRELLEVDGWAAFNRIPGFFGRKGLAPFENKLKGIFGEVKVEPVQDNLIYWGKKS